MSFDSLLVDVMDVYRPKEPDDITPPEVADDFAHLEDALQGEGEGEDPTLEGQPCRLFEKTTTVPKDGKIVTIVVSSVWCRSCDVLERDVIKLTPLERGERTFAVDNVKEAQGARGVDHLVLSVSEVQ